MENILDQEKSIKNDDVSLEQDMIDAKEENELQNKLNKAFKELRIVSMCLENCGFDIDSRALDSNILEDYGELGIILAEDAKMRIKIIYDNFSGLKILLEEKFDNPIYHDFYELRKLEIKEAFENAKIYNLL